MGHLRAEATARRETRTWLVSLSLSLSLSSTLLVTGVATVLLTDAAYAQQTTNPKLIRYRMVKVTPDAGDCSTRAKPIGKGLNDCGDVTGYVATDHTGCNERPFFWTLCDNYPNIPIRTVKNLATMTGATTTTLGEGREINNAGVVVGLSDATMLDNLSGPIYSDGRPWSWEVATYTGSTMTATALSSSIGAANSVNNGTPVIAAGYLVSNGSGGWEFDAFRVEVAPVNAFTLLGTAPGDDGAWGNHVTEAPPAGVARIVGGSQDFPVFPTPCSENDDALSWPVTGTTASQLVEDAATPSNFILWGAEARAANPQGQSAGARLAAAGTVGCESTAVFWEASGTPVEVGLIAPLTASEDTVVEAMTSADGAGGSVMLVGTDPGNDIAWLWWRGLPSQPFTVLGLSDLNIPAVDLVGLVQAFEFVDVNELGWILGNARFTGTASLRHAILLVPDPCGGDFDVDGDVDASDLAVLLGAWGPCANPNDFCEGDLDHDGTVGAADLAILLGMWGTCTVELACATTPCGQQNGEGGGTGGGEQSAASSGGTTGSDLSFAAAALGFADESHLIDWLGGSQDDQALAIGIGVQSVLVELANSGGAQ